jgi:hypothetical protein
VGGLRQLAIRPFPATSLSPSASTFRAEMPPLFNLVEDVPQVASAGGEDIAVEYEKAELRVRDRLGLAVADTDAARLRELPKSGRCSGKVRAPANEFHRLRNIFTSEHE